MIRWKPLVSLSNCKHAFRHASFAANLDIIHHDQHRHYRHHDHHRHPPPHLSSIICISFLLPTRTQTPVANLDGSNLKKQKEGERERLCINKELQRKSLTYRPARNTAMSLLLPPKLCLHGAKRCSK